MILRRSANISNPVHPDSDQCRGYLSFIEDHLEDPVVTEANLLNNISQL